MPKRTDVTKQPTEADASAAHKTASAYLEGKASRKAASTVHFYRDHIENHIVPALGHVPITTLTRQQCHAFTLSLLDKKLAHSSRVGILTTLSAVLTAAVDDPRCPLQLHPAIGLRKHLKEDSTKLKSKRLTKDKYFERDEVAQLLAAAQEHFPKWYLFVFCGLRTGLRLGELLALQRAISTGGRGSFTCNAPG